MAQVNVYVPDDLEAEIRQQARRAKTSLSRYIGDLLRKRAPQPSAWPREFFTEVVGHWEGGFPPIPRPPADEPDTL